MVTNLIGGHWKSPITCHDWSLLTLLLPFRSRGPRSDRVASDSLAALPLRLSGELCLGARRHPATSPASYAPSIALFLVETGLRINAPDELLKFAGESQ